MGEKSFYKGRVIDEISKTSMSCGIGFCPAIYQTKLNTFLIVGKHVPTTDLSGPVLDKIAEDEAVVEIPSDLLAI